MSDTYGSFLRERRAARGSQQALADQLRHLQLTQSRLSEIEKGQMVPDRIQEQAIGAALGFTDAEVETWRALILSAEAERRSRLAGADASEAA